MNRPEKAVQLHHSKFNCAQCIACAFSDVLKEDEQTLFRMAEAYGGGMGCMKTCGAVTAMGLVIGLYGSDGNMENPGTKGRSTKLMRQAIQEFEKKNQTVVCRELKGAGTGQVLRSCDGCIQDAAEILDKVLFNICHNNDTKEE